MLKIKKLLRAILKSKPFILVLAGISVVLVGSFVGSFAWYSNQLLPVGSDANQRVAVKIESNSTPSDIAKLLEEKSIIRSASAFRLYLRLTGKSGALQAGTYLLSPSESVQQIVEHLVKGTVDSFSITFYPGATLVDNTDTPEGKKYDVTTALKKAGYSEEEIAAALAKTYNHPLFQDKPTSADLEGYIYGETYTFNAGTSVEEILTRTFDEYYKAIEENNLIARFADHGLNLYEGITLASIIQREMSGADDQRQAAQVFYSRLEQGMLLGSDVTYQYIADKLGVARDTNIDSPYNTRRYAGLPPGPIAVPGLSALLAVADPADGDYLYFLAGDDKIVYFVRTEAEHEQNIIDHCQTGCLAL